MPVRGERVEHCKRGNILHESECVTYNPEGGEKGGDQKLEDMMYKNQYLKLSI